MIADFNTMPEMFWKCNYEYFDDKLPTPRYRLLHSYNILGRIEWYFEKKVPKRITLRMSDYFDFDEQTFRNIMVHEMIHYQLLLSGADTKAKHGEAFLARAQEMNEKYGLNITVHIDARNFPLSPTAPPRSWWRCLQLCN